MIKIGDRIETELPDGRYHPGTVVSLYPDGHEEWCRIVWDLGEEYGGGPGFDDHACYERLSSVRPLV